MTEKTVDIKWPLLILAILLGPGVASAAFLILSLVSPVLAFTALIAIYASLYLGYVTYLILSGPLMVLAQFLGFSNPVFHGLLGYLAVLAIPHAHAAGMPFIATPDVVQNGQFFGPLWCATAAAIYTVLSGEFSPPKEARS